MSLITHIDGVPLYTSVAEALLWARQYGLTGYHTHNVLGQVGYMGGTNHADIVAAMQRGVVNPIQPAELRSTTNQSLPTQSTSSSGGGGY
tara:strand:- start:144 stop:413 length:270 start_codon:yes stop_codon:yes gene_type:complete